MTNIKLPYILKAGEIVTRIGALKTNAAKVQEEMHILGVACLDHVREHGNTTLMMNLLDSMPVSTRREAMCVWAEKFSGGLLTVTLNKDGISIKLQKGWKDNVDLFDINGAWTTPFYSYTKEKRPGESLTVERLYAWLKKRANEDGTFDDGTPKVSVEAQDLAAQLVAYVDEMSKPKLQAAA